MRPTKTYLWIRVLSRTDGPEEIRGAIGLEGDRHWKAGGLRPSTRMIAKENGWQLDSGEDKAAQHAVHLAGLVRRLEGYIERIRRLPKSMGVHVGCAIYAGREPGLFFEADTIAFLASIGATFDIDLYILGEAEAEEQA